VLRSVHLSVLLLLAVVAGADDTAARRQLIQSVAQGSQQLGHLTLAEVVEATSGKKVLPFSVEDDPVAKRILGAVKQALTATLEQANAANSEARQQSRINEVSKFFEDRLREQLHRTPGFSCDWPKTSDGKTQRSGYPDLRLVHLPSGRVTYLDPKVYAEDSEDSSFRTFYFEPAAGTGKITEDAHHLILGIAHDGKTGEWKFTQWKVVDVAGLSLQLKAEFNASNRELYTPAAVRAVGE
jgi:hypothetical protein